jgi:hypothetical protein
MPFRFGILKPDVPKRLSLRDSRGLPNRRDLPNRLSMRIFPG